MSSMQGKTVVITGASAGIGEELAVALASRGASLVLACVAQIVSAMERREREVVMTAKGKVGLLLKLLAPRLVDRIALNAVREKDS